MRIPIGENVKGKQYINLDKDAPHYLVGGATGMGKSTLLHCILTSLAMSDNCPDLFLADLKGGIELGIYKDLIHTQGFVKDLKGLNKLLGNLIDEMNRRYEQMYQQGITKYRGKRILFVLDEMIDLYRVSGDTQAKLKSQIKYQISELTAKSRAAKITVILCTQRPDAQVVDGIIKTNINNKICFRVVDSIQSQIILGKGNTMAEDLPEIPGRCVMYMNTKKEIVQVYYLDYERAKELLKGVDRREITETTREVEEVGEDNIKLRHNGLSDDFTVAEDS